MYIRFEDIELEGFMSIGQSKVPLANRGMTRIHGINNYDTGSQSNGAGKSTILDGIIWTLTEETARGAKDVININWKGWVLTRLKFQVDDNRYEVRRTRKHPDYGTNLNIIKNDEDISGNTYTKSKEILKTELNLLDTDMIISILLLSQGLPGKFSSMKPKKRKERLEELSNSMGFIGELQSKVGSKLKDLNKVVIEDDKVVASSEALVETHRTSIQSKKDYLENQEKIQSQGLSEEEYSKLSEEVSHLQNEADSINSQVQKVDEKYNIKSSEQNHLNRQLSEYGNQITQAQMSTQHATSKIEYAKENVVRLGQELNVVTHAQCYACHQNIVDQERVESMKSEITEKIRSEKTIMFDNDSIIKNNDQLIHSTTTAKEGIESALDVISKDLNDLSNDKQNLFENYTNIQSKIKPINDRLKLGVRTQTSYEFIESEITQLEEDIVKLQKDIDEVNKRLGTNKKEVDILNWLNRQSSREFRSYLLEGVVQYLNQQLSTYSEILYDDNSKIQLVLDKNNLDLRYLDKSYENLSGGERRRIDLCMQLALRDLCMNETGLGFNILALDEIFDNLDSEGISRVLDMMKVKSSEVDSLLIITHNESLSMPYDSQIVVEKGVDGLSQVVENH